MKIIANGDDDGCGDDGICEAFINNNESLSNLTTGYFDEWDILNDSTLIRVHGSLMLTAWIFAGSIGILISRYFKQTWVKKKFFGCDSWFFLHRSFMLLTWTLTMTGFVVIFVDMEGWIEPRAHKIMGLITTILCFLMPIGAMFRPNVSSPRRKYFNWGHTFGGTTVYFFALITIFLAVPLEQAKLPVWMSWIMTGFVIFHFLTHVAFTVLKYKSDDIIGNTQQSSTTDAPLAKERIIVFIVYSIIVSLLLLTMIITVVTAPMDD